MKRQHQSYLLAMAAVAAWSTVSTAFKLSLRGLSPLGLLMISSLTSSIFLLIMVSFRIGRPAFRGMLSQLRSSILPGILNPFLYYLMLFFAYDRLPAQEAQVLNYTWAIILSFASALVLKQGLRPRDGLALVLSFIGVIVISTRGNVLSLKFSDPLGSWVAVATSLVWAAYWIINMRDDRAGMVKMMYGFLVGTLMIGAWFVLVRNGNISALIKPGVSIAPAVFGAVYVGLFEMGFTFVIWMAALQKADNAASVSNLVFLTPFISLILIRFILLESIHVATLGGLALIVGSNVMQKWDQILKSIKRG